MFRSGRESYGDNAIGKVQLKREDGVCTIKARISPEHRVRSKHYAVLAEIDEDKEEIVNIKCMDCAASLGKHWMLLMLN